MRGWVLRAVGRQRVSGCLGRGPVWVRGVGSSAPGSPRVAPHTLMSMIFWMEYAPISMAITAPIDILMPIGSFHSISM